MFSHTVNVRANNDDRDKGVAIDILSGLNKIYDKIQGIDPEYVLVRRARNLPLDKIQNILCILV